jgi:hypothetical protein
MVSVSFSNRCTVTTYEHVNSMPPTTCPQLADRSGTRGYPGSPSSSCPMSTMSKDLGIYSTSSKAAFWDGLRTGSLKDPGPKAAWLGTPSDRGSASFVQPSPTHGEAQSPVAPIRANASAISSHVGAPATISFP